MSSDSLAHCELSFMPKLKKLAHMSLLHFKLNSRQKIKIASVSIKQLTVKHIQ